MEARATDLLSCAAIGINVIPSRAHFMEGPVRHSGNFACFVTDEMERA